MDSTLGLCEAFIFRAVSEAIEAPCYVKEEHIGCDTVFDAQITLDLLHDDVWFCNEFFSTD